MGSITEGVLGGLQIAQQKKRDENTQKSQELVQTFAILQSLQHNQDRLNDLEQESAQLQTTRFQAVADEAVKQRAMTLAQQGSTDQTEKDLAVAQFQAAQGARQALEQRISALMSQKDTVRGQNAALSDFMAKYALLQDIAGLKQNAIPAAMQPIPMPQQGQQSGGAEGQQEDFLNPSLPKSPSGQAHPAQAGGQQVRPEAVPAAPPMNAEQAKADPLAFQLDLIKRKVDPGATIENGQIVIHAATTDDARRLDRQLQEVKGTLPFTTNATVIDDEGVQNRTAIREDRQAMAKERQAKAADFEAKDALSTAEPALRDTGVALTQDQSGATRLVGPGGAAASLVEMTPDPKDPTKMTVQGASQEKAAAALTAAADSAEKDPQAAKLVVKDMGQGIRAYVEDLASHGDVQRKGRSNDFVVNLFGRDPDQAMKIKDAISRISNAAKSKDTLPKLVLPDPGSAVFQYSQYATTNQRIPPEGEGRASASGMSDEATGTRNDVEKLLGYLKGFTEVSGPMNPKTIAESTLSPADSRRVVSAFDHPGGYNLLHFKGEGKDRVLKSRLMDLIHPSQRAALEDAIRRIP